MFVKKWEIIRCSSLLTQKVGDMSPHPPPPRIDALTGKRAYGRVLGIMTLVTKRLCTIVVYVIKICQSKPAFMVRV